MKIKLCIYPQPNYLTSRTTIEAEILFAVCLSKCGFWSESVKTPPKKSPCSKKIGAVLVQQADRRSFEASAVTILVCFYILCNNKSYKEPSGFLRAEPLSSYFEDRKGYREGKKLLSDKSVFPSLTYHLQSAQFITNAKGEQYEHIEYTPYGELWIEETAPGIDKLPFRFTGKELDEETGLYYYGARYLDPKYSRWLSGDPALNDYIPKAPIDDEAKKHNENLPGMGGVFNVVNLHVYHYAGNNPVKYTDPDGRDIILLNRESGALGFGHNAILIGNDTDGWMYYSKDGYFSKNEPEKFATLAMFMEKNSSTSNYGYNRGYRISTNSDEDEKLKKYAGKRFPLPYSIFAGNMEMEFDMTDAGNMEGSKAVIMIYPDNIKENCADLTGKILDHGKKGNFFPKKFGFTHPNAQFEMFKDAYPDGKEIPFEIPKININVDRYYPETGYGL